MSQSKIWDGPKFDPANLKPEPVRNTGQISWWVEPPKPDSPRGLFETHNYFIWGKIKIGSIWNLKCRCISQSDYRAAWNPEGLILRECAEIENHLRHHIPNPDLMDAE